MFWCYVPPPNQGPPRVHHFIRFWVDPFVERRRDSFSLVIVTCSPTLSSRPSLSFFFDRFCITRIVFFFPFPIFPTPPPHTPFFALPEGTTAPLFFIFFFPPFSCYSLATWYTSKAPPLELVRGALCRQDTPRFSLVTHIVHHCFSFFLFPCSGILWIPCCFPIPQAATPPPAF